MKFFFSFVLAAGLSVDLVVAEKGAPKVNGLSVLAAVCVPKVKVGASALAADFSLSAGVETLAGEPNVKIGDLLVEAPLGAGAVGALKLKLNGLLAGRGTPAPSAVAALLPKVKSGGGLSELVRLVAEVLTEKDFLLVDGPSSSSTSLSNCLFLFEDGASLLLLAEVLKEKEGVAMGALALLLSPEGLENENGEGLSAGLPKEKDAVGAGAGALGLSAEELAVGVPKEKGFDVESESLLNVNGLAVGAAVVEAPSPTVVVGLEKEKAADLVLAVPVEVARLFPKREGVACLSDSDVVGFEKVNGDGAAVAEVDLVLADDPMDVTLARFSEAAVVLS